MNENTKHNVVLELLPKPNLQQEFHLICGRIAAKDLVLPAELLPFLCFERKEQRSRINLALAQAYYSCGNFKQAKIFIQRAWLLSNFSLEIMPLYRRIHASDGDNAAIRQAYKRLGMKAAEQNNISEAINYFNAWHYTDLNESRLDSYSYDFDILACLDSLAAPYKLNSTAKKLSRKGRNLRVGYLLHGIEQSNPGLMKVCYTLAVHHNQSRISPEFFTLLTRNDLSSSAYGEEWIAKFKKLGYEIHTSKASSTDTHEHKLFLTGKQIHDRQLDILITAAGLATFENYFLAALRPAPIIVGLIQGPPPQYASPSFDWCISWSKHALIDTPSNCSLVELKPELSIRETLTPCTKQMLELPGNACILLSAGRPTKFQETSHWLAVSELLSRFANAYYLVCGVMFEEIPALQSIIPPEIRARIRCLGWREDFLDILAATNIVIDTYPNGGGLVIAEAMALGIPVVAHRNDYMQLFDQTSWSPGEDYLNDADTVIARGDFNSLIAVVSKLIEDPEYEKRAGQHLKEKYKKQCEAGQAEAVKKVEDIYDEVFKLCSFKTLFSV